MSNAKKAERPELSLVDEHIEGPEDFSGPDAPTEAPPFNSILFVWREVLRNSEKVRAERISPEHASKIVSTYPDVHFSDIRYFHESFYDHVEKLRGILEEMIDNNEECLSPTTPEEDVAENSSLYKELLILWQVQFLTWQEFDWDVESATAPADIAVLGELHKMFFAQQGLIAFLDNIKFEFTEADQADLIEALNRVKEEASE